VLSVDNVLVAPDVEPMPFIFGPSADASSFEDEEAIAGDVTASSSAKSSPTRRTRSMKASRLEESDADSGDRVLPVRSPHTMDTDVADAAQRILSLGKILLSFVISGLFRLSSQLRCSLLCRSNGLKPYWQK